MKTEVKWHGRCACQSELIILEVYNSPNWWWCWRCDAVYDHTGQYKGKLKDLESKK